MAWARPRLNARTRTLCRGASARRLIPAPPNPIPRPRVDEAAFLAQYQMPRAERLAARGRATEEMVELVAALRAKGWGKPAALGLRARLAALAHERQRMDSAQASRRGGEGAGAVRARPAPMSVRAAVA